jgi:hypothetical protein
MGKSCRTNGEQRDVYRTFVGKPQGKRPLGRQNNIKMDLTEIGWDSMDWIVLPQDRAQWRALLKTVMNLGKFLSSYTIGCFSRRPQLHEVS